MRLAPTGIDIKELRGCHRIAISLEFSCSPEKNRIP
jgi:hypothetical protein